MNRKVGPVFLEGILFRSLGGGVQTQFQAQGWSLCLPAIHAGIVRVQMCEHSGLLYVRCDFHTRWSTCFEFPQWVMMTSKITINKRVSDHHQNNHRNATWSAEWSVSVSTGSHRVRTNQESRHKKKSDKTSLLSPNDSQKFNRQASSETYVLMCCFYLGFSRDGRCLLKG